MSISSRISSMEEHVTNAYNGLAGLGADLTNVNKNIENISMVLDDIYDSMPQVSGEGTSLTLNDTRVGKIKSTLKGNTSQTTYSGKNLLHQDQYLTTRTTNGITYTNNGDGTFNVTGTATANTNIQILAGASQIGLESGKTYYFYSSKPYNGTDFNMSIPFAQDGAQKYLTANNTIATSGTLTNIKLSFYVGSGVTVNAQNVKLMLVEGSTPGDYEPFVGGTASPNPDFPQLVNVVSGDNTITISNQGGTDSNTYNIDLPVENLLQLPNGSKTTNGITATITNGKLKIAGTTTTNWFSICNLNIPLESGTYTFSYTNKKVNRYNFNIKYADNTTQVIYGNTYSNTLITLSQKATITGMFSDNNTTGATFDYEDYLMIEKGSKANKYTPYGTTPIELCKIGNYQDYFYKDSGKWYLHKEIGKVVLNGSENWTRSTRPYYQTPINDLIINPSSSTIGQVVCNYFEATTPDDIWSKNENGITNQADGQMLRIRIKDDTYTLNTFKEWLTTHNLIVYYVLATPVNTALEDM